MDTSEFGETPCGGLRGPLWLAAGRREYACGWATPVSSTDTPRSAVGTAVIREVDATRCVDGLPVTTGSQ